MSTLPNSKKPYTTPEITKVKMQPEQAVLSCCNEGNGNKTYLGPVNYCYQTCEIKPDHPLSDPSICYYVWQTGSIAHSGNAAYS